MPETASVPATETPASTPAATPAPVADTPKPAAPEAAKPAAPAKDPWADFKAPEGFTVESLKPIVEWAQKSGLDPKAAAAVAMREKQAQAAADAEFKHLSEKGWLEELQKDPELGGEKIRETMVDVTRTVDRLSPKTQALIKEAGILYNPVVVRILHDIGTKMREDQFVRPGATPGVEKRSPHHDPLEGLFQPKSA
jgi:hypothetical protein